MANPNETKQTVDAKDDWIDRLQNFDRRWVFLAMAVAIVVPFMWPLGLPIKASPMVKSVYDTVEVLKEGDVVFMSLDLDPASLPELEPFYKAVLLQLKQKRVKIVVATTWYAAPPLLERWMRETMEANFVDDNADAEKDLPDRSAVTDKKQKSKEGRYEKNVDYVWLGFREGKEAIIAHMGKDLHDTFDGRADDGTPLKSIPWLKDRKQLKDFDLLVLISAGSPGVKEYVQQVQARYKLNMVASCTAVSTTDLTPYVQAGQLRGLVGGMTAAAEYETLVDHRGSATQGADVLNVGHIVVILAILFGNLIFFVGRARDRKRRTA